MGAEKDDMERLKEEIAFHKQQMAAKKAQLEAMKRAKKRNKSGGEEMVCLGGRKQDNFHLKIILKRHLNLSNLPFPSFPFLSLPLKRKKVFETRKEERVQAPI